MRALISSLEALAALEPEVVLVVESLDILAACIHRELLEDFAAKHRALLLPLPPRDSH
ncbi:MAG: hypothetical protein ABUL62_30300 [Myxococcales bacterium]